ncbi:MAG: hypothetical protein IJ777_01295 [Clostridia bacterium]|nr:hypothetical protein [Clostridia bacterium]
MKNILLKQAKGITLIALVVTIVVLLILAGITIQMVFSENGIIHRAQNAAEEQKRAGENDISSITDLTDQVEGLVGGNVSAEAEWKSEGVSNNNSNVQMKFNITGTQVTTPPNPDTAIFEHVAGTSVADGYVIRDKENGNEFVWVPVAKNQKLSLTVTSTEEDINSIKVYTPDGDELLQLSDEDMAGIGRSYQNTEIQPTLNGPYVATVTTNSGTEFVILTVESLYAKSYSAMLDKQSKNLHFNNVNEVAKELGGDVIDQQLPFYLKSFAENMNYEDTTVQYGNSESVYANGGFYVGRYEAGKASNEKAVCTIDQIPYTDVTVSQAQTLTNNMYNNTKFHCDLLTGSAWDRIMGYIQEGGSTSTKTEEQVIVDSKEWGNYAGSQFTITRGMYREDTDSSYHSVGERENGQYEKAGDKNVLLTTGAAPTRNVSKNIYDLAGNVEEWIAESQGSNVVLRGGNSRCH